MMISIIVPFYKGNQYLHQMLQQFKNNQTHLKQHYPEMNLELVIMNDSPSIQVDFEETEDIHIINNEQNLGIHGTRINGLNYIKGEFVLFLDQDDKIEDYYIVSQYEHLKDSDVVVCNAIEEKDNLPVVFYKSKKHQVCCQELKWYFTTTNQILSPGQCLIKVEKIPTFWKEHTLKVNGADDMLLWVCMLLERCKFNINEEILYTHVDTGSNVSDDLNLMTNSKKAVYDLLVNHHLLNRKQQKQLYHCICWKEYLYESHSTLAKVIKSLCHPILLMNNIHYQLIKRKVV